MPASPGPFVDPPWDAPLEAEQVISEMSPAATMAGMFFLAVLAAAKRRHLTLPTARARYLPFGFYPITEFAPLLVAAARTFHPDRSLRQGLRALGRAGPRAFLSSVLGKVTLGAADGAHAALAAVVNTYALNIRPSRCVIVQSSPRSVVVSLDYVEHFLDSHHVGVFEGTLEHARAKGSVRIASRSRISADLLIEWS